MSRVDRKDLPLFWRVTKKAIESVTIHLANEQNNARLRNPVVRTAPLPIYGLIHSRGHIVGVLISPGCGVQL